MTNTPEPSADVVEAVVRAIRYAEFGLDAGGDASANGGTDNLSEALYASGLSPREIENALHVVAKAALSASPAPSQGGLVESELIFDLENWPERKDPNKPAWATDELMRAAAHALRTNDQTAPDGLVGEHIESYPPSIGKAMSFPQAVSRLEPDYRIRRSNDCGNRTICRRGDDLRQARPICAHIGLGYSLRSGGFNSDCYGDCERDRWAIDQ